MAGSGAESAGVKLIEWEDLQQELARLWSLSSALKKAKERKETLARKLESVIQERSEYLHQTNEIEEMRQKLEAQKLAMGDLLLRSKRTAENVKDQNEQLCFDIRLLLVASKMLSAAHQQLQEANKLLSGERGHGHLRNLQKMVHARQQDMVAQVSALYPVKASGEQSSGVKCDVNGTETGYAHPSNMSKPSQMSSFSILDLQLPALPLKKTSLFGDKKELQRSATALGYVAHAVLLIAAYLDVPLRYPLRFGGSRSYIHDYAPSTDLTSSDLASGSISVMGMTPKPAEFPLFLEGQDSTRATYAIFLLNKDIEQLLNYVGAQSLGPKHVLPNLKELMRIILAKEYIAM
ncbi:hypothetical protein Taro_032965 [Colocasia esculenta]|uniref:UV radiation resistance-associated gene protein n=1 Tax=Colocasia esculenta TaxID=4460 RepID=A0A843VYR3_COLES|nr:hypothetical protein [Colocasia esculenta]